MIIEGFDLAQRVLVIAEIGNNHEGHIDVAHELIDAAADSGVGAVKFQTLRAEKLVRKGDVDRFERLKSFELTNENFRELSEHASRRGLIFLSTPFDLGSVALLDGISPVFKIASGDSTFEPLIEAVALTGKPILLSSGATTISELRRAKALIETTWGTKCVKKGDLAFLHCVAAYPTPDDSANIAAVLTMKQEFPDVVVGYSDHTMGIQAALMAVTLGARVVEKHFTLDHNYSDFRDHQLSANPEQMKTLVAQIDKAQVLVGNGQKVVMDCESDSRVAARRSIVARHDLPPGSMVSFEDLNWTRPGDGEFLAGQERELVGRVVASQINLGEPFAEAVFESER